MVRALAKSHPHTLTRSHHQSPQSTPPLRLCILIILVVVGADSWGKLKLQRGGRKGGPSDTFSSSATHYVTSRTVETQTSCHFVSLYVTVLSHQWPRVRAQCPRSWWMIVISKLLASCSTPPHLHISDWARQRPMTPPTDHKNNKH